MTEEIKPTEEKKKRRISYRPTAKEQALDVDNLMLTEKQERFAQAYVRTKIASEAYRAVYNVEKMSQSCIWNEAYKVLTNPKVSVRVKQLKEDAYGKYMVGVGELLAELEEARQLALRTEKAGPAVAATVGKAKMLGFDKQIVDHQSSDGSFAPTRIEIVTPEKT